MASTSDGIGLGEGGRQGVGPISSVAGVLSVTWTGRSCGGGPSSSAGWSLDLCCCLSSPYGRAMAAADRQIPPRREHGRGRVGMQVVGEDGGVGHVGEERIL